MSSLGRYKLINCQVAPAGRMMILTREVLLSHKFVSLRLSSCTCWSTWRFVGVLIT